MRDRPFVAANEPPRPFSEVLAERALGDPRRHALDEIARIEGLALEASDPAERKRLQCDAEDLRAALHELNGRS